MDLATEIKPQLRIDPSDDSFDDTLTPLITAAREWCEGFQNRAYVQQTWELALDTWPRGSAIRLPRPQLHSVESLTYTDSEGATTTWDETNYIVDDYSEPAQLVKVHNVIWPTVKLAAANGIRIRYVAGYEPVVNGETVDYTSNVPEKVKQAIILLVSAWFETPGIEPPQAVKSLLSQDRIVPI